MKFKLIVFAVAFSMCLQSCKKDCLYTYEFVFDTEHGSIIKSQVTVNAQTTDREVLPIEDAEKKALEYTIANLKATNVSLSEAPKLLYEICE